MADATAATAEAAKGGDKTKETTRRKSSIADKVHGLTKQQRILGGLIACIALTIATIVMLQPDIIYTNSQKGSQQTGTSTSNSEDKPATSKTAGSESSKTATTPAAIPSGTAASQGTGSTAASSPSPAATPTASKTYDGQSPLAPSVSTQPVAVTYPYPWSPPAVQLAQHATPQNQPVTQAQINAWDSLTAPGITQPETPADSQAQPATPSDDATASPAESVAAPPEVKATKMNLNLTAKHSHESYHAHDDLTINEWQDGYYVLHRNAAAGDDIFSLRPGDTVHIDGMDCTVTQSIDVPASTYFEDIRSKVGWDTVVFHTCHRPASANLVRIVACRPSVKKTFGVWHNGELIDSATWLNRISD